MQTFIFLLTTMVVLGGALGVVLAAHPVHAALSLVAALIGMAVFFLQLDAQLVAAVQVIVYASAIVVLFLFVIMLLGVDRREVAIDWARPQTIASAVLGVVALTLVLIVAFTSKGWTEPTGQRAASGALRDNGAIAAPSTTIAEVPARDARQAADPGNIRTTAEVLFTQYAWALELTGVLLTLGVVGAVILAKRTVGGPVLESYDAADLEADQAIGEEASA